MNTALEQLEVWIEQYQKINGTPPIEEIKMQIDLLKDYEKEQCNIDIVSKRYFAVNYVANSGDGQITGLIDITTNGNYLNREMTLVNITEKIEGLTNIVITSTNEMSEEDFKTWQS